MVGLKERVEGHLGIFFASTAIAAFVAGWGAHIAVESAANLECIQKGTYVLKKDVVGNLLRNESIAELGALIEVGENLNPEQDKKKAETYMLRVLTFVHHLDLPKDGGSLEKNISRTEERIDFIIRDIPNTGSPPRPLSEKINMIVGVLQGLRSSLVSNVGR
jgi:hypothetical protein